MGNLLCVPKSKKRRDSRDSHREKSLKRWRSKGKQDKHHIGVQATASDAPSLPVIYEQEVSKQSSASLVTSVTETASFNVHPVVSSSILLRHFDEEVGDDEKIKEALEKSDDPVYMGKESLTVTKEPSTAEDSEQLQGHADISTNEENKPVTQLDCSDKETDTKEVATDLEPADIENLSKTDSVSPETSVEGIFQVSDTEKLNGILEAADICAVQAVRAELKPDVEKNSSTKDVCPKVIQVKPCSENQFATHYLKKDSNDKVEPANLSLQKKSDKFVFTQSLDEEAIARANSKDTGSVIDIKLATPKLTADNYDSRSDEKSIAKDQNLLKKSVKDTSNTKQTNYNDIITGRIPEDDQKFRSADLLPSAIKTKNNKKAEMNLKGAYSCPIVPKASKTTAHMREIAKVLEALSAIKIPAQSNTEQSVDCRNALSPQPTTSNLASRSGYYKSDEGIQKWLENSASDSADPVKIDTPKQDEIPKRKVSDFEVPKKVARKPKTPLVLKKPMPHLFSLPSVAKTDLDEDKNVNWTQKDINGPQTDVLWANKPTSYDVKFPPLPKRLLEREGSIEKMIDNLVLPQTKQIETLKREYGRFPGLKIPQTLKDRYSFDIQVENTSNKVNIGENDSVPNTDRDDNKSDDKGTRNGETCY